MPSPLPPRRPDTARTAERLRFQRPQMPSTEDVERYFERSRATRRYTNRGPCHELLIERVSERLGGRRVVPAVNGSMGLLVALRALVPDSSGERREVLLPSFTFAAAPATIQWCGLTPVFCDIDPDGWHLCPEALRAALEARGHRVAAVFAGTTFGTPPPDSQLSAWRRLTDASGIPLVVDSAAGFGAVEAREADAEIFSMHATKPLPAGEGGLLAVRDATVERRAWMLINHGLDENRIALLPGLNGKLDEWHAATALCGLDVIDENIAVRQAHARVLRAALSERGLVFQAGAARSSTQFVPALMPSPEMREATERAAEQTGVEVRTYFDPPLHRTPAYSPCARAGSLDVTDRVSARIISLPMAVDLTAAEREMIVDCVTAV